MFTVQVQLHTAEDYGLRHQFELLGSKGYLRCDSNPWLPGNNSRLVIAEYEQPERVIDVSADGDGFLYLVRNVIDAIEQGQLQLNHPAANLKDSAQITVLLSQWYETKN
ncbi:hypothetical protein [Ferrimonas kyonanensis]|uniref:hypothetical protein n=1 Tax=Ferrimonas kyonanensis TaxID=364763 RepID=UPI0004820EA2|nr:hypothetical protein [Ferrimonas kyonanensis]